VLKNRSPPRMYGHYEDITWVPHLLGIPISLLSRSRDKRIDQRESRKEAPGKSSLAGRW
jgi:hypothetical protein